MPTADERPPSAAGKGADLAVGRGSAASPAMSVLESPRRGMRHDLLMFGPVAVLLAGMFLMRLMRARKAQGRRRV